MFVVIFRAKVRALDEAYFKTAARLRELALKGFGCIKFHALTEGPEEIALSYWPTKESIKLWKAHPEHLAAQKMGREKWYEAYSVQIAEISREYRVATNGQGQDAGEYIRTQKLRAPAE